MLGGSTVNTLDDVGNVLRFNNTSVVVGGKPVYRIDDNDSYEWDAGLIYGSINSVGYGVWAFIALNKTAWRTVPLITDNGNGGTLPVLETYVKFSDGKLSFQSSITGDLRVTPSKFISWL